MQQYFKAAAHYRHSDGTKQSITAHLEETSKLACRFAGKIGLPSMGELIGLLHDLGKHSDIFQRYLLSAVGKLNPGDAGHIDPEKMKGKIDHSSAGAQYLWESLKDKGPFQLLAGHILALVVASHHSGLSDCLSPDGRDPFTERMKKPDDQTYLSEAIAGADKAVLEHIDKLLVSHVLDNELRLRLHSLFDGELYPEIRDFKLGLLIRFVFSALIDADRLNTANFEDESVALMRYNGAYPHWSILIKKFEVHLSNLKIRNEVDAIRNKISSSCLSFSYREKGLYKLTVPTGGGKTLASLRFALHHAGHRKMDRIVYVVPYTSIIDQNASEVRRILEDLQADGRPIVLEHHSNLSRDNDTWQSRLLSENWDAPIVFTTAVQFLETLFASGTRGARRMHQLANSVIVFDEIQTLPIRTVHLFNNAVNFLVEQCGATAVFCTATQPLLDKVEPEKGAARLSADHEIYQNVGGLFKSLRRVEIIDMRKPEGWTDAEIAETARRELEDSGSVLIIVNTKAQARKIYLACQGIAGRVFHLSTSMCPAHRMRVIKEVRERLDQDDPMPFICVSTQLIEAGVDVDFGSVIRSLAGLDSIAQAAGRCNRNGRRETGRVLVVNPAGERLEKLYDIRKAREVTERVLYEFHNDPAAFDDDLLSPSAMNLYYKYYFFERAHEMVYPVPARKIGINSNLFSLLSTNELSVMAYAEKNRAAPPCILRQSFKTASEVFEVIDAPTQGVIVPYKEGEDIINGLLSGPSFKENEELLKKAQRYSVNVFPYEIEKLREKRRIYEVPESGVMYLDPRHYSDEFGASLEQVGPMEPYFG